MMCPPSVSGRSAWALEELESIVAFTGVDNGQSAVVYRTSVASYKLGELDLRKKKHSRILYSARNLERYFPYTTIYPNDGRDSQLLASLWVQ
jgi:hypothetical protein